MLTKVNFPFYDPRGPRVLGCGGREYSNQTTVNLSLQLIRPCAVGDGCATGADTLVGIWSRQNMPYGAHSHYPIQPDEDPFTRNERQLQTFRPNVLLVFAGGRGTEDMERRAMRFGAAIWYVRG